MRHLRAGEHDAALRFLYAARSLEPDNAAIRQSTEDTERRIRDDLKKEGVVPEAIPMVAVPMHDLGRVRVSAKAGFLLSRIDGRYDLASILKISPMQQLEALLVVRELVKAGVVKLKKK